MWNLKCDTDEPTYETETDSWTPGTDLRSPRGKVWGRNEVGCWS